MATHESHVAHGVIKTASNRSFGLTVGGILVAIALLRWIWFGYLSWLMLLLLVVGGVLIVLAASRPAALDLPNRLWTKLGAVLFHVVNPVVMLFLFVVTIVPAGLIMRLVGYDPMRRRFAAEAETYWLERAPPGPPPESLHQQY